MLPTWWWLISERADILHSEEQVLCPEDLWKTKEVETHRYPATEDPATAQLLFRIIMSVNQLIVHGAVSDWCEELAQQISAHSSSSTGKPLTKTNDGSESKVAHTVMSILTSSLLINVPVQGNLVRQHNERFENLPEDIRVRKASADPCFFFFKKK